MFDGSETDFIRYLRLAARGTRQSSRDAQNPVSVRLADETDFKHNGRMDFVDNVVNPKTGTIRGRAIFDNKDGLLTPGFFGRLRLYRRRAADAAHPDARSRRIRPARSCSRSPTTARSRTKKVELGPIVDGLRVIRSGLEPTDRIVIEGLPRARPGQKVTAEDGTIKAAER